MCAAQLPRRPPTSMPINALRQRLVEMLVRHGIMHCFAGCCCSIWRSAHRMYDSLFSPQNLLESVTLPTLLFNSLVDTYQTFYGYNWPSYPIFGTHVPVIRQQFSDPLHASVQSGLSHAQAVNANINYFTYSCLVHCMLGRDFQYTAVMTGGYRLSDVVSAFYYRNAIVAMFDAPWTLPQAPHCPDVIM